MSSSKYHQTPTANIEQELLRMLAHQGWMGLIPTFLLLSVIASFAAEYVSAQYWVTWITLATCFLLFRSAILIKLPSLVQYSDQARLRLAISLSAINGTIHALSLAFFPDFNEHQRMIQTMILMGIGSITIMTTAGFLPISLAYIAPTILSTASMWAVVAITQESNLINYVIAIMLICSSLVMLNLSKESFELIKGFFLIRGQQESLNAQLQRALQEAENASRAKTRFLASASHDLRQPIHALSLFSGALSRRTLDKESREIASHMDTALQSLVSHLDSLLDISKLDAGIVQANNTLFNLRLMGERLQTEFIPTAGEKKLKIWFDCIDDALVETDEFLLDRILRNLLSNGIKYTKNGSVLLSIETQKDTHTITISDTGQGIPENEQQHIFEEFYQLDNPERDNTKGLGLGLAIVRRLVNLLNVKITMKSTVGKGTHFTITIKRSFKKPVITTSATRKKISWNIINALVIDDEEEVGLGMQALLEGLGCKVAIADSTESALILAQSNKPNIILADLRLRGTDNGILSIQAIRKIYPQLPAILISGDTAPERLQEAEKATISILHKPVLVYELEQAIAEVFQYIEEPQESCLET